MLPEAAPDGGLAGEAFVAHRAGDFCQDALGGLQQLLALAAALAAQARVEAQQEPLAGEVGAGDLGDGIRDQAVSHHRGLALPARPGCGQQLAQVLGCQGGDPVQTGRLQVLADAGRGEHAAVADQGDAGDAETLLNPLHLPTQRGWIGRVPGEHLDSQGTAIGRAQQPEHDLLLALFAVPVVAEGGQRAEAPLQIAGTHVVQDQGGVVEVPVGEAGLDPLLAGEQPVEHGEHLVARDGAELEQSAEAGVGGLRGETSRGGELGVGGEHACHHGGERQVALAAAVAVQDALEPELAAGEVGEGLLANALAFAPGLAEQDGGFVGAVGDDFEVERHGRVLWEHYRQCIRS